MVVTPLLLKKVVTLSLRMCDPEDLTVGVQPFVLSQHTASQIKSATVAAKRYSTVVGGGVAPSLDDTDVLLAPDGVSLPSTFLEARGQLTQTRVSVHGPGSIYADPGQLRLPVQGERHRHV